MLNSLLTIREYASLSDKSFPLALEPWKHWRFTDSACMRTAKALLVSLPFTRKISQVWPAGYACGKARWRGSCFGCGEHGERLVNAAQVPLVKNTAPRKDDAARLKGFRVNRIVVAVIAASLSGVGVSAGIARETWQGAWGHPPTAYNDLPQTASSDGRPARRGVYAPLPPYKDMTV